jgi:NAD(P)H dehydrogenase (quinone)
MSKRILVINGNPATQRESFTAALCHAYDDGARDGGHEVRRLDIAALAFDPILHEGLHGDQPLEPGLVEAQDSIQWANHLVFVYPMWQFGVPALLKGFCERTLSPSFAYGLSGKNPLDIGLLKGRSARLIQTMGMPDAVYTFKYQAHGGKAFRSLLDFCGIAPVGMSFLGQIESGEATRRLYLARVHQLGFQGI